MTEHRADTDPAGAHWMRRTGRSAVRERLVEVAGEVFATQGADASMADIAAAAGCSRATLYRYFDDRRRLQVEYIETVARRIGGVVEAAVAGIDDPERRLTESVVIALGQVRADPALSAWFTPGGAGTASELALSSEAIASAAATFLGWGSEADEIVARHREAADWVIRVIVSFLAVPGGSPEQERAMIARFVVPGVLAPPRPAGA